MKTFHIIWTDIDGTVNSTYETFDDFETCEEWLKSIGATYWEIGMIDTEYE
jgi:hypothetical protein